MNKPMKSAYINSTYVNSTPEIPQNAPPTFTADDALPRSARLTQALRALGALAIAGSGLLYMLQGLQATQAELRNWIYLALMGALAAGGFFSYRLMQDSKGARLFLALAVLLVPVQFSQLGGMVLHYLGEADEILGLFSVAAPETGTLLWTAGLSFLLTAVVIPAGFSVLCRPHATFLGVAFSILNALLLLPFRSGFPLIFILAGMAAVTVTLDQKIFRTSAIFKTAEGASARLMILLPLAIAFCRSGFHYSDTVGASAVLAAAGFAAIYFSEGGMARLTATARELLLLLAYTLLLLALPTATFEFFQRAGALMPLNSDVLTVVYAAPLLLLSLDMARRSQVLSLFYQIAAMLTVTLASAVLMEAQHVTAEFLLLLMTAVTATAGFVRQQKLIFLTGVLGSAIIGIDLIAMAVQDIKLNLWLALAVGGVTLVALSSVLEKHGRKWLCNSREYWRQFNEWEAR